MEQSLKRKVVKHGPSSLTISLPMTWAKKNGVKPGDEIEVEEIEDYLLVGTKKRIQEKIVDVDCSKLKPKQIRWAIQILYKEGYDEIRIRFSNPEDINVIEEELRLCTGLEILEQSERRCVIKNITKNLEYDFKQVMRRNFLNSLSMVSLMIEKIKANRLKELHDLLKFEETNNKLCCLCQRMINANNTFKQKTVFQYVFIWTLEKIVDEFKEICLYYSANANVKISKEIIGFLEKTHSLFRKYYEVYYSFSFEKLCDISDLYDSMKILKSKININTKENVMWYHLSKVNDRIMESLPSLFALNSSVFEVKEQNHK